MVFDNEQEFKEFYLECFPGLRIFIFAKCNNIELSEDIAQESFIRIWKNSDKIEKDKVRSYLFTVANNLFLDHIRHEKVKTNYTSAYTFRKDLVDPQYLIEMDEFRTKLESTINSMPENAKVVFLMNRMEKMTYQQIADSLNLSVKAIEKRMQKALKIMATINL